MRDEEGEDIAMPTIKVFRNGNAQAIIERPESLDLKKLLNEAFDTVDLMNSENP